MKTIVAFCVVLLSVTLLVGCSVFADQKHEVAIKHDDQGALLLFDNNLIAKYRYKNVAYKPYIEQLYTPSGINVVRDMVPDHLHHHGLMYAVAVDGVNFWEEQQEPGVQKNLGVGDIVRRSDMKIAGIHQYLNWMGPSANDVLLNEEREIQVQLIKSQGATLLTWEIKLSVPLGKEIATLSGSHYFGLGMRFVESMDAVGKFSNADGKEGRVFRGEERLVESDWCAYAAAVDGKPVTVAIFGYPANLRHPTTWFTMAKPFAYMSATLNLHEEPLKIMAGKPLKLRYGVALWDGHVSKDQIQKLYGKWAGKALQ